MNPAPMIPIRDTLGIQMAPKREEALSFILQSDLPHLASAQHIPAGPGKLFCGHHFGKVGNLYW